MTRLFALWESMRATYWVVPSLMAALAFVLALGMVQLDRVVPATILDQLSWVYTGGPEGARAVLATIAGSMVTVAGVTFSVTIVALTLASQQFGPRLLRNFLRDRGNQLVLGTFVSTFMYCLLVLRTVRGHEDIVFVPHLAVTVGVALATCSVGVLIFFIHHISTSIQASQVIANVAREFRDGIERLFPEAIGESARSTAAAPEPREENHVIRSAAAGYVQGIDSERLMSLARKHDAVVRVEAAPGAFVTGERALLIVEQQPPMTREHHQEWQSAFIIGASRTGSQDLAFFIDQLVELALRALSPGINDPATARSCVDRLEEGLCHLAGRHWPSAVRQDEDETVRVIAPPISFGEATRLAFEEIERHTRSSVSVRCRLLEALGAIASCTRRVEDRAALAHWARRIKASSQEMGVDADRVQISEAFERTMTALQRADSA
jgi:uncharacterized membrane protein